MLYIRTKFHFNSASSLGCVFNTTMGLAAILNPRWRLFQNLKIFSLPTNDSVPHTKLHFNSPSRLSSLFYTTIGLAAILDPRRRLF